MQYQHWNLYRCNIYYYLIWICTQNHIWYNKYCICYCFLLIQKTYSKVVINKLLNLNISSFVIELNFYYRVSGTGDFLHAWVILLCFMQIKIPLEFAFYFTFSDTYSRQYWTIKIVMRNSPLYPHFYVAVVSYRWIWMNRIIYIRHTNIKNNKVKLVLFKFCWFSRQVHLVVTIP